MKRIVMNVQGDNIFRWKVRTERCTQCLIVICKICGNVLLKRYKDMCAIIISHCDIELCTEIAPLI